MTAMGVVIGTTAIVVLVALANGLQESALGSFEGFGALNQITVLPGAAVQAFGGGGEVFSDDALLTPDALREFEEMEGVVAVTPIESLFAQNTLKFNRMQGTSSLTGIDPRVTDDLGYEIAEGSERLGNWTVIIGSRVGENFADQRGRSTQDEPLDLYGQTLILELQRSGDDGEIEKRTIRIRVGGVLVERGGQEDNSIYIALEDIEELNAWATRQRTNRRLNGYNQAIVVVDDPEKMLLIEQTILLDGYYAFSARSLIQQVNVLFTIIQAIFGGIGAIALLVAAIGIANTMIMSILERTREIGLMKAVGATNRDVMTLFITEAGAIGMLGGIGGAATGWLLSQIINVVAGAYINAQTAASGAAPTDPISVAIVPLWLVGFAIGFSLVIGLLAGIYPALRAVQLNPVTALKYE